jgi:hypothetical protein
MPRSPRAAIVGALVLIWATTATGQHFLDARDVATASLRLRPFTVISKDRVGVLVDPTSLAADLSALASTVTITLFDGEQSLASTTIDSLPPAPFEVVFPVQALSMAWRFEGVVTLTDGTQLTSRRTLTPPETPAWLGRYEVPTDFVPHPWTALQVEADTVTCWGRRYVFGDAALPQQILVHGQDILAGPMQLSVATAAGLLRWDGPMQIVAHGPAQVVLQRAGEAPGLDVSIRTTIDFDGFVAFDVDLTPTAPVMLDEVSVGIPVRYEVARFFHVDGGWRELRWGAVARRAEFPALASERYYYWVGDDDVGLSWMTDRTAHWQASDSLRTGFHRQVGQFQGFFQPWSHRAELREPFRIRLALEATPTRPEYERPLRAFTSHNTPPERFAQPLPKGKDTILEMSLQGKFNFPPYPEHAERIADWIKGYVKRGIRVLGYHYISQEVSTAHYHQHWGDWEATMPPILHPRIGGERGTAWSFSCFNSSWSDYYCHIVDRTTSEFDTDGIYLDGIMQERMCERPLAHGPDCDQTWPLFASRAHIKKLLYLVQQNRGSEAFLWGHSSDNKLAPFAGVMDLLYEGENYGGAIPYKHLTTDVMRAQFGRQFGPRTVYIPQLTREDIPPRRLLGMLALHGVECPPRGMTHATADTLVRPLWETLDSFPDSTARFVPYFEQQIFEDANGLPVSVYIHPDGGRLLLVLANQSARAVTYQLQYQPRQYRPSTTITDIRERLVGQRVRAEGDHIDLTLNPWDFRLLDVQLD